MKYPLLFHIVLVALSLPIFAQDADVRTLNQQIATLYQQGNFDDAVPLAVKVIVIEKKAAKNSVGHAMALTNLGQINKEKAKALRANLKKFEPQNRFGALSESKASAERAKKYYREALNIFKELKAENTQPAIALKNELAWIVANFTVSDSIGESRSQIDEAERFYSEALTAADSLTPADVDTQMFTLQNFGDFYMKFVNFEKAQPLYERYLQLGEAKYGAKAKQLASGLRGMYEIYMFTDQAEEAKDVLSNLVKITGNTAKPEIIFPVLTARSRGIAKVKADGFFYTDLTDLDRSWTTTREIQRKLTPPGQFTTKWIEVEILVGEDGNVTEAKVLTPTKYTDVVTEAALASKLRPFEYNGKRQKIRGKLIFDYKEF